MKILLGLCIGIFLIGMISSLSFYIKPLVSASDSQTQIACGGDAETLIVCEPGAAENAFMGMEIGAQVGGGEQAEPIIEKAFLEEYTNYIFLFIIIALFLFLILFLLAKRRKKDE